MPTTFRSRLPLYVILIFLTSCGTHNDNGKSVEKKQELTPMVNVFIGTGRGESDHPGARGNTHPGATTPWGMVATSPQTFDFTKTQLATGYRDGKDTIYGFSCVNFSGIGCPAGGSVPFKFSSGRFEQRPVGSSFSKQKATPGYYGVFLNDERIHVETSVTTRSAIFRLQLPKGQSNIYLDLTAQQGHVKGGEVHDYSKSSVDGYQLEGYFCGSDTMGKTFFYAELEKEADSVYLVYGNEDNGDFKQGLTDRPSGIVYQFMNDTASNLQIKTGVSFVSKENAKDNLMSEQEGFDFDQIREQARLSWERELGKIQVSTNDQNDKTIFYTALYHSLLMPITYSDVNGDYVIQGSDHEIGNSAEHTRYTGFSLWDTYRTVHPLLTLVYPEKQLDMVRSMVGMYRETGYLPKWEVFAQEPNIMVGDPAAIVIADTYMKGIEGFDVETAYRAMKKQADSVENNVMRRGLRDYLDLGYIAMDGDFGDVANFQWKNGIVWGAVSTTMEFNLADYGIAQMAGKLKKESDRKRYMDRSLSFLKLYDDETGFIRPKNKDGSWYEPFDPEQALWDQMNFGLRGGPGFVEGSAWNYLFSVPHAIDTLQKTMGRERFLTQLNQLFEDDHFDMTNEPGLGFPFMYNHTTLKDTKTAKLVHECLVKYFRNMTNGLPGNDDAGTMSAWVVFAMMGIYPHTPGSPEYTVTIPSFDTVSISLDTTFYKNDTIRIIRKGPKNGIVDKMTINTMPFNYWLNHTELTSQKSEVVIETKGLSN